MRLDMTSSKILNMYHLLTDVYKAKVERSPEEPKKGEQRTLLITLTIKGEEAVFNSKSEDYRQLIVTMARKNFNETFTEPNFRDLNQRLETISKVFQPE